MSELEKIPEEIEELRGQVGSECTSEDHCMKKSWECCLDLVGKIIRKHLNDGWISVEDRLPEDDVDVLVTYADMTVYLLCPNCGEMIGIDESCDKFCRECGQAIDENVEGMEDE